MTRLLAVAAAVAGAAVLAAGCSTHSGPSSSNPPQPMRQNPTAAPQDLTQAIACFRSHGLPDYPDPTFDPTDGRWHYPDIRPALTSRIRQACASVLPTVTPASPIPSAQLHDLLAFAGCMRAHGLPDWPDPGADGRFLFATPPAKSDPGVGAAGDACQRYLASSGGTIQTGVGNG